MVIATTFAMALGTVGGFGGFGGVAHAAPAGYGGRCSSVIQVNDVQAAAASWVLYNSQDKPFATEYIHMDAEYDNTGIGGFCDLRARADVFPMSGYTFGETYKVEMCYAASGTGTANECYDGGNWGTISGSQTSYTCPNIAYPNHCAIVGPWVDTGSFTVCKGADQLDAEGKPVGTNIDTLGATAYYC